jgi:aryl-alcohol dehydrogenase-like predicted oxidoreductase
MASFPNRVRLGRSGLSVGPLGVSGGYGVETASLLKAFDRGVNYFYHGSRRRRGMTDAIRDLVAAGRRDELVVVLQSYARTPGLMETWFARGLKQLGLETADVLLLGWYSSPPAERLLERALSMTQRGMVRHIAISAHHRPAFLRYAADPRFTILHIRYNAAHTGAETDVFPHLGRDGRPGAVAYTATRWGSLLSPWRVPDGETPLRARDCYRFVLSNHDFNVCMTGPKNAAEMDEALAALDEGPLTAEEDGRIRRIGRHVHEHAMMGR